MKRTLLDFSEGVPEELVEASAGVTASEVTDEHGVVLRMEAVAGEGTRDVTLKAPDGCWDVSDHLYIAVDLHNVGSEKTIVSVEVNCGC